MRKIVNTKLCPILGSKIMSQSREEVPIILQFNEKASTLKNDINSLSTKIKSDLPIINGFAGNMTTETIYRIVASPEIDYISFDTRVHTLLDIATATMDADFPHNQGFQGKGVTVAVLDTGVAPHMDLVQPQNRIIGFKDFVNNRREAYDDNGHGSHVAGIIAGNGLASKGRYAGLAPEANILAIKVLDENGGGSSSDIIAALSYIAETKNKYNTKIINLSLGTPANSDSSKDPLCRAVEKLIAAGFIVIAAAGNSGPQEGTILSPGISRDVITVGAIDDKRTIARSDDTIASFSSRGPTPEGLDKPDLMAPGVNIKSLSNVKLNDYTSLSGTSMSTPLVSGSVALLLNKYGHLSNAQVKDLLLKSSYDLGDNRSKQGAAVLNLELLFREDDNLNGENLSKSKDNPMDTIIVLLIVLFLLDSRI